MVSPGPPRADRVQALDGLRGLACLAVLGFHYLNRGPGLFPEIGPIRSWAFWGLYGVDLFFVISGFVIFMTIQHSSLRRFVISRAIRLYPLYWVCVVLTFAVVTMAGLPGREVSVGEAVVNLTMLQEFFRVPHVDGAYWTLTVEVSFYFCAALLLAVGAVSGRRVDFALAAWLTIALGVQLYNAVTNSHAADILMRMFGWAPLFIIGIVLYGVWAGDRRAFRLVLIPISVAILGLRDPRDSVAAAVIVALVCFALWGPRVGLESRPLRWLGTISFALYLIHQNIGYVALRALRDLPSLVSVAIVTLGMLAAATLLTYAFDIPVRRALRGRLLPTSRIRGT